jgi:hypothetical protein
MSTTKSVNAIDNREKAHHASTPSSNPKPMRKDLLLLCFLALLAGLAQPPAHAQSGAYFQAVTNLHPIGYWPLTENTSPPGSKQPAVNSGTLGTADNGTYSDGAFPGVTGALAGDSDKAGLFSGAPAVSSHVALPYDAAYALNTVFTVELWVNSAIADPGTECVASCLDAGPPRRGWLIYADGAGAGTFNFRTYANLTAGTGTSLSYTIPIPGGHLLSNKWYHVAVSFDGTTAQGYINGQPVAVSSSATGYLPSTNGTLVIGARSDSSFPFPGFIDEVAFYSNILSASDVLAHYSAGTNSAPSPTYQQLVSGKNPQLYFRLDEDSAPVAINYGTSGAFVNGYYEAGTSPGGSGPSFTGFASPSYACSFNSSQAAGIGPSVVVPGAAGLSIGVDSNNPVTFTLWAQASSPPTYFTTVAGKGDQSYRFDINDGSGVPHWNAGNENEIAAGRSASDGNWHFWAGTWDGTNVMNLYMDGLLIGQSTGNSSANGNSDPFTIGTAPDTTGRNMQGSISHVALFTSALTTSQIQNLWFAGGAPPTITVQPLPTVAIQGSNVSITVSAFGKPALTYQWYSGSPGSGTPVSGGNISGGTTTSLTFTSAQPSNDGEYYVVVTDGNGATTTSQGVTLTVITSVLAGSYFPAVINLNPLAYWPLHETNVPPAPDIATNYGTLGAAGNAAFSGSGVTRQIPGALTDGDTAILTDGSAGMLSVPFAPVLSTPAPFSAEGWFSPGQVSATQCAMSCMDANNPRSGWLVYIAGQNAGSFNFRLYNQNGTTPSLNISSPANGITAGQFYHVVVVYDGSQGYIYINGQLANSAAPSGFVPNDAGNFSIAGRSDRGFLFLGEEDEVAFYTNALSASTILAHYMAGTNSAPVTPYKQLVLQSNPLLYYRLDEPSYTAPPLNSNPAATNYGASGSSEIGYYLPGSAPGAVSGPVFPGFSSHAACHFNNAFPSGFVEVQDSGGGLNVLGPVTLTAWVKGDPGNIGNFQSFAGRGDASYRGDVDQSGDVHFADGGNSDALGTFINDGGWHFFAGTWDGVNETLYIDGVQNAIQDASSAIPGDGLPFVIGGDGQYSVGANPSRIFNGGVSEVAVFGTALTAQQVQSLYNAALVPPYIVTQPTNIIVSINTTGTVAVVAGGTPNLGYRWYKGTSPLSNSGDISGATTPVLTISPAQLSDNGSYSVVITNTYGGITSAVVSVTVVSGPIINPDLPATNYAYLGTTANLSVGLGGTGPFTNGWKYNGQNLADGDRISGSHTPTLSIANAQLGDAGAYQFWSTNGIGVSHSSVGQLVVQNVLGFNGNGNGWTLNTGNGSSTSPSIVGINQVQMTTANRGGQSTSFFFDTRLYVGAFKAFFTYYDVNDGADGVCFVLQNSAMGVNATGAGGGGMGVRGITNSFEVEIDLYNELFAVNTGGLTHEAGNGFPAGNPEFPLLNNGDDVGAAGQTKDMTVFYDGNTLSLTWSNETSLATASTNIVIGDITQAIGGDNKAFIGFTGACGGVDDTQIVGNFAYIPLLRALSITPDGTGGVFVSWPAVTTWVLQQNSSISNPGAWSDVSGPYPTVSAQPYDQYRVHVTPATGTHYYRLIMRP